VVFEEHLRATGEVVVWESSGQSHRLAFSPWDDAAAGPLPVTDAATGALLEQVRASLPGGRLELWGGALGRRVKIAGNVVGPEGILRLAGAGRSRFERTTSGVVVDLEAGARVELGLFQAAAARGVEIAGTFQPFGAFEWTLGERGHAVVVVKQAVSEEQLVARFRPATH
jgi:hypothetical protein